MEKQGFEDAFRDAFKEAASSPSGNVWTNIELELERNESDKIKRRLLFYKILAAASVAFAMVFGGAGLYIMQRDMNETLQQGIASNQPVTSSQQHAATESLHTLPSTSKGDDTFIASNEGASATTGAQAEHNPAIASQNNSSSIALSETSTHHSGTAPASQQSASSPAISEYTTTHGSTIAGGSNRNVTQAGTQPQRLAAAMPAGTENNETVKNSNAGSSAIASNNTAGTTSITKNSQAEGSRGVDQSAGTQQDITAIQQRGNSETNSVGNNSTDRVGARNALTSPGTSNGVATDENGSADKLNGRKINSGIDQNTSSQQVAVASPVLPGQSTADNTGSDQQSSTSGAVTFRNNTTSAKAIDVATTTNATGNTPDTKSNQGIGTQQASQQLAVTAPAFNPWQTTWTGNDFNNSVAPGRQQAFASKIAADSSFRISRGYNNNFSVALDKDLQEDMHKRAILAAGSKGTSTGYYRNPKLPALVDPASTKVVLAKEEPSEEELLLASMTPAEEEKIKDDKKKATEDERLWTSVGFAAGTFSSVKINTAASNATVMNSAYAASALANEAGASGTTYSAGLVVGGKISERWVVQGGLNYLSQSSNYQSDVVIRSQSDVRATSVSEVNKFASLSDQASYVNTAPYNVNNSVQFISIPVQAGYVVLNRAFGIQLNGGVSTDLFFQNVITPDKGSLDKITNGRGADSPYRPLNFSGLVGTEFTYRFGTRYRLAVNPGVRYPFSSIYKPETDLEATPVTFDVGVRFRYIFK